jgi:gliding motility-associated-like protein
MILFINQINVTMKNVLFIFFFLCGIHSINSQPFFNKFIFGSNYTPPAKVAYAKQEKALYVLHGTSGHFFYPWDMLTLYKFDESGKKIWHKVIKNSFFDDNSNNTLLATADGNVVFTSRDKIDTTFYFNIRKVDRNGNLLWSRTISQGRTTIHTKRPTLLEDKIGNIWSISQELGAIGDNVKIDIVKFSKDGNVLKSKNLLRYTGSYDGRYETAVLDAQKEKLYLLARISSVLDADLNVIKQHRIPFYLQAGTLIDNKLILFGQADTPSNSATMVATDPNDLTNEYWGKTIANTSLGRATAINDGNFFYFSFDQIWKPQNEVVYKMKPDGSLIWVKKFSKCSQVCPNMDIQGSKLVLSHVSIEQVDTSGRNNCFVENVSTKSVNINYNIGTVSNIINTQDITLPKEKHLELDTLAMFVNDVCAEDGFEIDHGFKKDICIGDSLDIFPTLKDYAYLMQGEFVNSMQKISLPNFKKQYFGQVGFDTLKARVNYGGPWGCEGFVTMPLQIHGKPDYIPFKDSLDCGEGIALKLDKNYKYKWNDGDSLETKILVAPKTYIVTITDEIGCTAIRKSQIKNIQIPGYQIDTIICNDVAFSFALNNLTDVFINDKAITPPFEIKDNAKYKLKAKYKGCPFSQELQVKRDPCTASIFSPTIFSPDDNGINDDFEIHSNDIEIQQLSIYDRWGELVFNSDNTIKQWNGKFKSIPANPDVYVYHLIYKNIKNGKIEQQKGDFYLKR